MGEFPVKAFARVFHAGAALVAAAFLSIVALSGLPASGFAAPAAGPSVAAAPVAPVAAVPPAAPAAATSAAPQAAAPDTGDEPADELILGVNYNPYILSEGLEAAQKGDKVFLPMAAMADLFDLYVQKDLDHQAISGYFKDPANNFFVDLANKQYGSKGAKKPLPPGSVLINPLGEGNTDLYVRVDLLNEIWPVKMDVNLSTLNINVTSTQKLPFELRLEREANEKMLAAREKFAPSAQTLPYVPNPYKIVGKPSADLDTSYTWSGPRGHKSLSGSAALIGQQDLAGTAADYAVNTQYANGDFSKPENVRLHLERQSLGPDKLPLGLQDIQGGDIHLEQRSLISTSANGRGVLVSNTLAPTDSNFDHITLRGTGTPGWEIEVYRNDLLINFGTVDQTGQYEFDNVPLEIGNNQIRVVLYGPQGQVQEKVENYSISGSMVKPGQTQVTAGYMSLNKDLIPIAPASNNGPRGMAANAYVAHGLTDNLTLFGSATELPVQGPQQTINKQYVTAGVMAAVLDGFGQAEVYKDTHGGQALDTRLATQFKKIRLNIQNAVYSNFESPDAGYGSNAKKIENSIQAGTSVPTPFGSMNVQLNTQYRRNVIGPSIETASLEEDVGSSNLRFTHQNTVSFEGFNQTSASGQASVTKTFSRLWELRSQAGLQYRPADADQQHRGRPALPQRQGGRILRRRHRAAQLPVSHFADRLPGRLRFRQGAGQSRSWLEPHGRLQQHAPSQHVARPLRQQRRLHGQEREDVARIPRAGARLPRQ